jgi:F-type H+-transporting ATPase subunit epsilon
MARFQIDLVSPEQLQFSGEVDQVDVQGYEGDFGVLAGHAPLIAMLRPGIVTIFGAGAPRRIVVGDGYAEVNGENLTILAQLAEPLESFDRNALATQIQHTEEDIADSKDDWQRDKLRVRLDQLRELRTTLGA